MIHPCNKDCTKRKVGCKVSCYKLLEYNMFHTRPKKKGLYRATDESRKSGIRQKIRDNAKRKHDMQYYEKYNK